MIDLDYMPYAVMITIGIAFVLPFLYSFFVDNWDQKTAQLRSNKD
jgi:hypothetical protein